MYIHFRSKGFTFVSPFLILQLILQLILFSSYSFAKEVKKPPRAITQTISLKLSFSGDINETYQFDGRLGERLIGVAESSEGPGKSKCENKSLFRQVIYREKKALEIWTELVCTIQGQITEAKPHRQFVDIKVEPQVIMLPAFSKELKNIQLKIQDIIIKPPKLK